MTGLVNTVDAATTKFDDFTGIALDSTNDWTVAGVNGGTAALIATDGGAMQITTGAADNDDVDVASSIIWRADKNCVMEVRWRQNDVDGTAINLGFSDATGEAADLIAFTFDTVTLTSTASNAVLLFQDPDATTNAIRCAGVKANQDTAVVASEATLGDAVIHTGRVECEADGTTSFYVDNILLQRVADAVTATTPLCIYLAVINREGFVNTLDILQVRAWQNI